MGTEKTIQPGPADSAASLAGGGINLPKSALRRLLIATAALAIAFSGVLLHLARFALHSGLYSYILLVPFIVAYTVWSRRERLESSRPAPIPALVFFAAAALCLGFYWRVMRSNPSWTEEDRLCVLILGFVLSLVGSAAAVMGTQFLKSAAFPLAFLVFLAPLPAALENGIEAFLQHRSADVAYWFLNLSGTPVLRTDTVLQMPGITLKVAPECSGIRSTIVLFLTSLVAGNFFFQRWSSKAILVVSVVVLGIFRNAFRIFVLAQLCIHISPTMIDSPLHHRGGPIFFAISMVPLLFLIWYLRKLERNGIQTKNKD